jgi:hypothetical protein
MNDRCLTAPLKRLGSVVGLCGAMWVATPVLAGSGDAVFYELTENMTFDGTTRTGTGALAGEAQVGTALCPEAVVQILIQYHLISGARPCYITAFGTDAVTVKGTGVLSAKIAVQVQGDNPVDAPEYTVMAGTLTGGMQVADARGWLIAIWGTVTVDHVLGQPPSAFGFAATNFTGMVRLPFINDEVGNHRKPRRNERAFYLGDDEQLIRVQEHETSLGWPTARFELNFVEASRP